MTMANKPSRDKRSIAPAAPTCELTTFSTCAAGYFAGKHMSEVLAGAMPGIPVQAMHEDASPDAAFVSHSELKNSLMSHQRYRNYTPFMEAEFGRVAGYRLYHRSAQVVRLLHLRQRSESD
ncbi:hypothetical protein J4G48_0047255 [Bradyrhizobium barranii subsp. apii]|nr:hypothetical protein [Bradyrhizobium barranii]UPT96510.1 hypothetical protein J4G48_0047255 [Bradyrhizobium barranii subsp. apii]